LQFGLLHEHRLRHYQDWNLRYQGSNTKKNTGGRQARRVTDQNQRPAIAKTRRFSSTTRSNQPKDLYGSSRASLTGIASPRHRTSVGLRSTIAAVRFNLAHSPMLVRTRVVGHRFVFGRKTPKANDGRCRQFGVLASAITFNEPQLLCAATSTGFRQCSRKTAAVDPRGVELHIRLTYGSRDAL